MAKTEETLKHADQPALNKTLMDAINQGDLDRVANAIEQGAAINHVNQNGKTPLIEAIEWRDEALVQFLIEKGASVNTEIDHKMKLTALHWAVMGRDFKIAQLLLKHGASINKKDHRGETLLHIEAMVGCADMLTFLLENGASPDLRDSEGRTALHNAVIARKLNHIQILIDHGSSLDVCDEKGSTLLHTAVQRNCPEAAELLMDHDVALNSVDQQGNTALHHAVHLRENATQIASALLKRGACVNIHNKAGYTPLHDAVLLNNHAIIPLLIEHGASIHAKSTRSFLDRLLTIAETPLTQASPETQVEMKQGATAWRKAHHPGAQQQELWFHPRRSQKHGLSRTHTSETQEVELKGSPSKKGSSQYKT